MSLVLESRFEVEARPNGVFVGHYPTEGLGGLEIAGVLESAAPMKNDRMAFDGVPRVVHELVAQYGHRGVFEGMNSSILKAHKLAFEEAWPRAYISAQLMRYCMEPLVQSPSMHRGSMTFPNDWCHRNDFPVESESELLEVIAGYDNSSGVDAEDHLLARVLGATWNSIQASEWIQLRTSLLDGPINIEVPNSGRGHRSDPLRPPIIEPKLCWKEEDGRKVAIGNAAAGLATSSERDRMVYQDGTTGLVMAATQLEVDKTWPKRYGFSDEHLPMAFITKGVIEMEASQVPLLAQTSAPTILNHPDFETLLEYR